MAQSQPPKAKKRKHWRVFSRFRSKIARTPWLKEYYKNLGIILSNSRDRIIFLILDSLLIILLLRLLSISLSLTTNIISQVVFLLFFLALLYVPIAYLWRGAFQLSFEISLNSSIYDARYYIKELKKPKSIKNYRTFQGRTNRVRENLKNLVEYSEILSPPIFNYELDRLQKRIDIFFNSASEVLVPINKLFSRAAEVAQEEAEEAETYYADQEPSEEEIQAMQEQQLSDMTGEIATFDLDAMDEFMRYLLIALFEKETARYSPFSFKHPVNLIVLSRFFGTWNSVISSCPNSKRIFEKASADIEDYYKQLGSIATKRRERMWQLRDEAFIVILSVGISTLVQYLIQHV